MSKIKIIQHSKTVGFSGTDRTAALFAKYLDKDKYDVYLLYRENDSANTRLEIVKELLGEDKVIPYKWIPGKRTKQSPYFPEEDNFFDVVDKINPDIMHTHYSGYLDWPSMRYLVPKAKWIGTNIFGYVCDQMDIDIYISEYNRQLALGNGGKNGPVLSNPIELPKEFLPQLKEKQQINKLYNLNIPEQDIWCLRVGRPDNPEKISLLAFRETQKIRSNIQYIIVGPDNLWREYAKGIPNIYFIDQIINDEEIQTLHSACDIYLHARNDGEICSTAIQQAMMYELPIISHKSKIYNGQVEMLQDVGYCVEVDDHQGYAKILLELIDNPLLRAEVGKKAFIKALTNYEASLVTRKLEKIYDEVLGMRL